MKILFSLATLLAVVGLACSSSGSDEPDLTPARPGASSPAATSTPASSPGGEATPSGDNPSATPTTVAGSGSAISIGSDQVVAIDWTSLKEVPFYSPPQAGSADPFYHVHTNPAVDGFFLSIEAYTTAYGPGWTGQLGTFEIDCSEGGTGICVHFDPDGPGPTPSAGSKFDVRGSITFERLDATGYTVILMDVVFSEGFTIPGPLRMASNP